MKIQTLFIIVLFSVVEISGCQTTTQDTAPSPKEKETAKKEITARIDEIIEGGKKLDIEAAIKPYSDSPEFRLVTPDGRVTDYATMKNEQQEFSKQVSSLLFTTVKQDFKFLSKDLVLCTWTGTNQFELITGEKFKIDPYVGTMLFSKTGTEWEIIYAHESMAPSVQVNQK